MTGSESTPNGSHDIIAVTSTGNVGLLPATVSPIPNEVLLIIFKLLLSKSQLKAVRCVCRLFARLVSPLLFDEIYISPHRPNIEVFRQIAEHQDLCRYPRTLIYDVQEFKANIDPQEYYKKLCHQFYCFFHSNATIQHVDKELEGLLCMAKGSYNPAKFNADGFKKYSTCRIVQRGLELYSAKAEEQDYYKKGEILACLCIGLIRLARVDKVKFQSGSASSYLWSIDWSENPRYLRCSPSPLARTWSPFHLLPDSGIRDRPTSFALDNVISAFSLTRRPLRVLDANSPPNTPYEMFHSKSILSRTFRQHSFPAMRYLENLTLHIDMCHHSHSSSRVSEDSEDPKEKTLSVDLLAAALHHMPTLRSLYLIGILCDSGNGMISISELFQTFTLPALESLDLYGMLASAAYICTFLRAQPRLRTLALCAIELSEGTWVEVVDDMRRWLHLDSLELQLPLREDGAVDLWDEDDWIDSAISQQIEEYVLNGGENPLRVPR